jgi:hypothetical protein
MENCNLKISANLGLGFLALATVVGAVIIGQYALKFKAADFALSVTGSAKKTVKSDQVIWDLQTSRFTKLAEVKNAYKQIETDRQAVMAFLKNNKIEEKDVVVQPASMEQQWDGPQVSNPQDKIYVVKQMITITSVDVDGLTKIANNIQPLVDQGVLLSNLGLQYNYTKLADERVAMLAEAMKDARRRAEAIASSDNQQLGQFIRAESGVVQVLAKGSVDISDYGSLDTSSIEKDIMITVQTTFRLK